MESFGRTVALGIGIVGVVFLLLFSKTVSVRWQRHETVRSMSHDFAEKLLQGKKFSAYEWEAFQKMLDDLGGYRAELTVYERRRFEDENGVFYLYDKTETTDDTMLGEGSYVRVFVMQEDGGERLLFGNYGSIVAGGRVQ